MSNRQVVSDEQKKQEELNIKRAEEYTQAYKGPVLSQLATFNQVIPNVIDNLIKGILELHKQVDSLTSENQKLNGELAVLKAVDSKGKCEKSLPDKVPKPTKK